MCFYKFFDIFFGPTLDFDWQVRFSVSDILRSTCGLIQPSNQGETKPIVYSGVNPTHGFDEQQGPKHDYMAPGVTWSNQMFILSFRNIK